MSFVNLSLVVSKFGKSLSEEILRDLNDSFPNLNNQPIENIFVYLGFDDGPNIFSLPNNSQGLLVLRPMLRGTPAIELTRAYNLLQGPIKPSLLFQQFSDLVILQSIQVVRKKFLLFFSSH
jgi:hypothetical protein